MAASEDVAFQVLSDVHADMHAGATAASDTLPAHVLHALRPSPSADVLCLAGDVAEVCSPQYTEVLRWVSERYTHVAVVLGNHEGYSMQWEDAVQGAQDAAEDLSNVHILHRDVWEVPGACGVTVMGATGWTVPPCLSWGGQDSRFIKDYAASAEQWALDDAAFLAAAADAAVSKGRTPVALTHFPPTQLPGDVRRYGARDPVPCLLATCTACSREPSGWRAAKRRATAQYFYHGSTRVDECSAGCCSGGAADAQACPLHPSKAQCTVDAAMRGVLCTVPLWMCGHTHAASDAVPSPGAARVVSNPLGYPNEQEVHHVIGLSVSIPV